MKKKKNGFTLIELVAVLIIMAIVALIVTPLVMNIIRKARVSADKRSIDAYGRSIELAIASYLLDTGKFPTDVSQLKIEYSGSEVVCETTQLNSDSSVYLTGCRVAGRSVDYTYGSDKTPQVPTYGAYNVGDTITYNNVNFYVIADSSTSESSVTLLKAEPLTKAEVNQYGGVGTANNHVNMYACDSYESDCYQTAYVDPQGIFGSMAYYSSETCMGYDDYIDTGCTTDYADSDIKHVVDAWKLAQAPDASEARLITIDELLSLGYDEECVENGLCFPTDNVPSFVIPSDDSQDYYYLYWTMSQYLNNTSSVWLVNVEGSISDSYVASYYDGNWFGVVVRPVIVLPKSALSS